MKTLSTNVFEYLDKLKTATKNLILAIGQDEGKDELHKKSIDLLLEVAELERILTSEAIESNREAASNKDIRTAQYPSNIVAEEAEEIRKVERKLPRWARNQQQINSKILNLFIELKNSETERVTEDLLTKKYGDYGEFSRNYNQMKIISPKNHAKVFEVKNGVVEIWEPVRRYVEEYKKAVFNGRY